MSGKVQRIGLIAFGAVIGFMLSLNFSAIAGKDDGTPLPIDQLRTFTEVYGKIRSDYVDQVSDQRIFKGAIEGMVSSLDPHSAYLDKDDFRDLQVGTEGEFGGLGIEVGMEDGFIKVVSAIDDTPASKAGLKTGDLIIKLDDTPVKGLSLNDAVKRMRGPAGSKIVLTVLRKGQDKPMIVPITRAIVKVHSVKYKLAAPGYGYIRITQFQERTGEALARALTALYQQNHAPLKGLILDLRNNPGGLLNAAVGVSAAFLPDNSLVVYTDGRTPDSKMHLTASPENYLRLPGENDYLRGLPAGVKNVPMIVLVNGGSASASEIVTGALKDHHRAKVLGTQTFGKGSVQTIIPLGNGTALKLTTARYFTPSGNSIQAKGITPDEVVKDPNETTADEALTLHEADLEHHLLNPNKAKIKATAPAAKPEVKASAADAKSPGATAVKHTDKIIEPGSADDFQMQYALKELEGKPTK